MGTYCYSYVISGVLMGPLTGWEGGGDVYDMTCRLSNRYGGWGVENNRKEKYRGRSISFSLGFISNDSHHINLPHRLPWPVVAQQLEWFSFFHPLSV